MKKNLSLIFIAIVFSFIGFYSCKKSSSASAQDNLVGNWKITSETADTNHSGTQVNITIDTSAAHFLYNFNSSGVLATTYWGVTHHSTWKLLFNNTYIQLADSTGANPSSYLIMNLSSTNMQLKDTISSYVSTTTFTKQ